MLQNFYKWISSLNLGLSTMICIMLVMAIGAFAIGEQSAINDISLFIWLSQAPLTLSWWLWIVLVLMSLLAVNTILCSFETVRTRHAKTPLPRLLAPQLMHAGFLLMLLAHLFSAAGSSKEGGRVIEGSTVTLSDSSSVQFSSITGQVGKYGMPTVFQTTIIHTVDSKKHTAIISPNHPYFYNGYGLYLKQVDFSPYPSAVMELHREPGANIALAGAVLFTFGNIVLLLVKRGSKQ